MKRRLLSLLATFALSAMCAAGPQKHDLKLMQQNMDAGTDLTFLFVEPIPEAVDDTFEAVVASGIPQRAAALAGEITAQKPDLVALQEATIWAKIDGGNVTVLFDQLALLMDALNARGERYEVVDINSLTNVQAPLSTGQLFAFQDRDVILARAELMPALSNAQHHTYAAIFVFQNLFPVLRGWMSVDVTFGDETVRFFNTHLESTFGEQPLLLLQQAQAAELIAVMNSSPYPVALAGDFNSNAEAGPEQTDAVPDILAAGYIDVWATTHPGAAGYTWPLFGEDAIAGTKLHPDERIDLIFTKGIDAQEVHRTNISAAASDHAGVVATVRIAN